MQHRPIQSVIKAIKIYIPQDQVWDTLHNELDEIIEKCRYSAPELMPERWQELSMSLEYHLGSTNTASWKQIISDIVQDKINFIDILNRKDPI